MKFSDQIRAFGKQTTNDIVAVHTSTVVELKKSWVEGSPLTGAPPLPIAQEQSATKGKLRKGVRVTYTSPTTALIFTDVEYAPEVEDNLRGVTFSPGTGPHGWKLTVAAGARVVEHVAKRIAGYRR